MQRIMLSLRPMLYRKSTFAIVLVAIFLTRKTLTNAIDFEKKVKWYCKSPELSEHRDYGWKEQHLSYTQDCFKSVHEKNYLSMSQGHCRPLRFSSEIGGQNGVGHML